jgi:hypothetical protein
MLAFPAKVAGVRGAPGARQGKVHGNMLETRFHAHVVRKRLSTRNHSSQLPDLNRGPEVYESALGVNDFRYLSLLVDQAWTSIGCLGLASGGSQRGLADGTRSPVTDG